MVRSGGGGGQLTAVRKQCPACAAAWTRPPGPGWAVSPLHRPAPQDAAPWALPRPASLAGCPLWC